MFIDKWKPFYAPEGVDAGGGAEVEVDAGVETSVDVGTEDGDTGVGSGRSALRKNLEKNFAADRKAAEKREAVASKKGRTAEPKRVAGGAAVDESEDTESTDSEVVDAEVDESPASVAAPESLSKEAKADWAKAPASIQAAFVKREQDMARGVEELKGRYAEIDKALAPHLEAIRRNGQSPARAVEQLFAWFQALSANPKAAFPALVQSFGYQPQDVFGFAPQQQQQEQEAPVDDGIPPALKSMLEEINKRQATFEQAFSQQIGGLQNNFAQQVENKTNELLSMWSKDKPHYEAVRQMMAQLIQSGAVPLKDGQVDLDGAYEMATFAIPSIREQILADKAAAQKAARAAKIEEEKKARQAEADRAKKAAMSVSGGAPGMATTVPGQSQKKSGKSVRESIMEAREQLSEG